MSAPAAFALGSILASLLWLGVFGGGLLAIRRHQPPRPDYGRLTLPCEAPPPGPRVSPPTWRHVRRHGLRR